MPRKNRITTQPGKPGCFPAYWNSRQTVFRGFAGKDTGDPSGALVQDHRSRHESIQDRACRYIFINFKKHH
jgi:hypothetical protein